MGKYEKVYVGNWVLAVFLSFKDHPIPFVTVITHAVEKIEGLTSLYDIFDIAIDII